MSSVSADFGGNKGKTIYSEKCPNGWVTGFYGAVGGWPEGMGITCSDGTSKWAGGNTTWGTLPTGVNSVECKDGYSAVSASTGSYLDNITPTCGTEVQRWGNKNGSNNSFLCPAGQVITGVQGTRNDPKFINTVGFTCGAKPSAAVINPAPVVTVPVPAVTTVTPIIPVTPVTTVPVTTGKTVTGTGIGTGTGTGKSSGVSFFTPMHIAIICSVLICIIVTLVLVMRRK